MTDATSLARVLDAALPQTQCTRCGYPDCRGYAEAMATDSAAINRCPPGGAEGVVRLAALTGRPVAPLDPQCGAEAPLGLAVIDEAWCIGCTLCLKACPADAIVGGAKSMHTVIDAECTGCELCIPACPVDCISMSPVSGAATGWAAWSTERAERGRNRYAWHRERSMRDALEHDARLAGAQPTPLGASAAPGRASADAPPAADKSGVIRAALERARARRTP